MLIDTTKTPALPPILGLFDKRIDGDDALWNLAGLRFRQAGLGAELYADTPGELEGILRFKPPEVSPVTVHLNREINLFEEADRRLALDFAGQFKGRIYGLIIHDQREAEDRLDEYVGILQGMNQEMDEAAESPIIFIEYAAGLPTASYVALMQSIRELAHISSCLDTGHIGLWHARFLFAQMHPGKDIFDYKSDGSKLPEVIDDIQHAIRSGADEVLRVIRRISRLKKPVHFHLHDGHPLSTFSPFGVSDHLSFLSWIPAPFEHEGKTLFHPMFGPSGLSSVIGESLVLFGPERLTYTLEIHPPEGRLPLGDASHLFDHWSDKENAERMNYWLSILQANQMLVADYASRILEISDM